jgi:hypothetical protein
VSEGQAQVLGRKIKNVIVPKPPRQALVTTKASLGDEAGGRRDISFQL